MENLDTTRAASPRVPPPVLRISENARLRLKEITAESEGEINGVRLSLKKGGCAGTEYQLDYVTGPEAGDEIIRTEDCPEIYIAPDAFLFVLGTEMDYKVEKFKEGFVFNNPNQVNACGCGESVKLTAGNLSDFR